MIENENATLKALLENPLGYIGSTDIDNESKQVIGGPGRCANFSVYTNETVTFRYPDNPENRAEKFK